jgi:DNA-binding NarL/FixJ family response regulator
VVSERESRVLAGVCQGWSNKEIATKLEETSEQSVKAAVARLMRKYQVTDRAHLAAAFVQNSHEKYPGPAAGV